MAQRWQCIIISGIIVLAAAACTGLGGQPALVATVTPAVVQVTPPVATEQVSPPEATEQVFRVIGRVTGRVINGTAGTPPLEPLPVTLSSVQRDFAPESVLNVQGSTDDAGDFAFDAVEIAADRVYFVVVRYRERNFSSQPVNGTPSGTLDIPVTVYELTEDPAVIRLTETLLRVSPIPDGLSVLQSFTFENTSDRLFTSSASAGPGRFASVAVNLPVGALVTGFDNEARYVDLTNPDLTALNEPIVVDTLPVTPGSQHRIVLSYLLPYNQGAVVEFPVNYVVEGSVRVEIDNAAFRLNSDQITHSGTETIENTTYEVYTGTLALPPRQAIRFEISGQLGTSGDRSLVTSDNLLPIFLAMVALVGGLIVLLVVLQRRGSVVTVTKDQLITGLVRQISELDAQHERGEINHDLYQQRRATLKAQLALLMEGEERG